jgi:RNA polymerase sigma-70 factor (ECF subfamily)
MYNVQCRNDLLSSLSPKIHKLAKELVFGNLDPEDVAQNALLKLLANTDNFPRKIYSSWLRAVVRNAACDAYRALYLDRKYLDYKVSVDPCGYVSENDEDLLYSDCDSLQTQPVVHEPDLLPRIKRIFTRLSEPQRRVFALHLQGYSSSQIANLTDSNTGTVKSRIHYARKEAQRHLAAYR